MVLAFAFLAVAVVSAVPEVLCALQQCQVRFRVGNETLSYDVLKDEAQLFGTSIVVVSTLNTTSSDYDYTSYSTPGRLSQAASWASLVVDNNSNKVEHAVFYTRELGVFEYELGTGTRPSPHPFHELDGDHNNDEEDDNSYLRSLSGQGIVPFFPDCYAGDTATHSLSITLVLDASATSGMSSASALAKLNSQMNPGKLIFLEQLNIRLVVNKVVFGRANDPVPLSRSGKTCTTAIAALSELGSWLRANPQDSAFTMLVSNCFTGITGATNLGSACGSLGFGTAQFNMLTIFHELGHGIGMPHTFQRGMRTTGGLMDYSNGVYNGAVQFHPVYSRAAACKFLNGMATRPCKYFVSPTNAAAMGCGDGFLAADEECECIDQSSSCGICQKCAITKGPIECSSEKFVYRDKGKPNAAVVADASQLSDPKCCSKNVARAKTLCGPGNLNACGAYGQCSQVCTKYMLPNTPSCGFDASGCLLGCVYKNKCRFDLLGNISHMPNGTPCLVSRTPGQCAQGQCKPVM